MDTALSRPHPRHLIGIDGGGTGTRARLISAQGALLGYGEAGPSALARGVEAAWAQVQLAVSRAGAAAGLAELQGEDCALGLGLAGANVRALAESFVQAAPAYAGLVLDSDAYTALLGAHGGRPGAIVAAGTGSVGEALHADGRRIEVGGWGFPVGDEGSGAWLGLRAMRHAQQAADGRVAAGALARAVWQVAGSDTQTLLAWCVGAGQTRYAELAPLVFDTAPEDAMAERLLGHATRALEAMARALDPAGTLPLALMGSVGRRLAPRLAPELRERCVEPQGDAAEGALHLIRRHLAEQAAPLRSGSTGVLS